MEKGEGSTPKVFAQMTPLLHVRPEKGEVCFTVSDVCVCGGVDLPPMVGGGLDAPVLI